MSPFTWLHFANLMPFLPREGHNLVKEADMPRRLRTATLLLALPSIVLWSAAIPQDAAFASVSCGGADLSLGTPLPVQRTADTVEIAPGGDDPAPDPTSSVPSSAADAATSARVLTGIEHFVACRNAGDYAAYAALLTPRRMLAEAGTTNPEDVIADLEAFNLPITILSLGDVRIESDGRFSAEFVHLFGPHLYYRSRLYVIEENGAVKFDEEEFLPEEPSGDVSVVDVQVTDFAFALGQHTMANDQFVVLRATNEGSYVHEIIVAMLPAGATVEETLAGTIPEEDIAFFGQATLAPGQSDDLVLVNMVPGTYTLLCLADEPDGVPHAARGMVTQVTIAGEAASTP